MIRPRVWARESPSGWEIADHPYDRGYFDCIEGFVPFSPHPEYVRGYNDARTELLCEQFD